jgi:hypothetical protein
MKMAKYSYDKRCQACLMSDYSLVEIVQPRCYFVRMGSQEICPCGDCLIKVMCTATCNERRDIMNKKQIEDSDEYNHGTARRIRNE